MNKYLIIKFLIIIVGLSYFNLKAEVYHVTSAYEINNLPTLNPGDIIQMNNGTWTDQEIVFKGNGTENNPIRLQPETPGQVILTGSSTLDISGEYLIVEDLQFLNGAVSGNLIEFRRGSALANNCRLTNVTIKNYSPADINTDSKWISLYGTYNRVDHCTISGKTNIGTTLVVWLDETPDYHQIDHNYFGYRPVLGMNGGETIRIGTSDWVEYESNTIVEYNLFEETDGEVEIISNKSVGNIYRYNTFYHCDGTLTLRHGSYCKVYGNYFIGDPDKKSGGVRIIGEGHEVYNNYFESLYGTSYRAAISMVNGIPDSPVSGYYQVKYAKVGFNTIVDCKQPIAIGAGKDSEKTLPPIESSVVNNLIKGKSGYDIVVDYDVVTGVNFSGNIAETGQLGIDSDEGFLLTDISLAKASDIYRPEENCIAIDRATSDMSYVNDDIDGQGRGVSNRDVGCDEVSSDVFSNYLLNSENVGADYINTSASGSRVKELKDQVKVIQESSQVVIEFKDQSNRLLNLYNLGGDQLQSVECIGQQIKFEANNKKEIVLVQVKEKGVSYTFKILL